MAGSLIFSPASEVGHLATVSVSSGSADSEYPAALLTDFSSGEVEAKPAMVTGTAGDWLLTFGSAQRIDYVVLWHNGDSAITFHVKAGATSGTTTVDATITAPAKRANGFAVKLFKDLTGVSGYSASGFQYWKFSFPTNTLPPGLKVLCYSSALSLTHSIRLGMKYPHQQQGALHRTDFGHRWPYNLLGARRSLGATVRGTATDLTTLETWFDACGGFANVTAIVLDTAVNDVVIGSPGAQGTGLTQSVMDVTRQPIGPSMSEVSFTFDEITSGLPEWI